MARNDLTIDDTKNTTQTGASSEAPEASSVKPEAPEAALTRGARAEAPEASWTREVGSTSQGRSGGVGGRFGGK